MSLIRSIKFYNWKEKLVLVIGLFLDKIYQLIPSYIFDIKNYIEKFETAGFLLIPDNSKNEVLLNDNHKKVKINLRKYSSDFKVFDQIWFLEEFKPVNELLIEYNIHLKTIIDAGANIGLVTLYLKKNYTDAEVLCIEPDPSNFGQLQKNIELNRVNNVDLIQGGVWSSDGSLNIDFSFRDGMEWSRKLSLPRDNEEGRIQAYSINTLLKMKGWSGGVDFLKIDVEGAEEQIFGETSDLTFLEVTRVITIEIHNHDKFMKLIFNKLQGFHFDIYFIGELLVGIKK